MNANNEMWRELLTVLEESVTLYKDLLFLGEQKRQALVSAETVELDAITRREELIILDGTRLEERRAKATAALANRYNLADKKPTLTALAAVAEPEMSRQVLEHGENLDAVVKNLVRVHETNAALINQALSFVQYNLNLLTHSQAETTYVATGNRGGADKGISSVILDRKI